MDPVDRLLGYGRRFLLHQLGQSGLDAGSFVGMNNPFPGGFV